MRRKGSRKTASNVIAEPHRDGLERVPAKRVLAAKLNELIDSRQLSQTEVAQITGMTQPKVSQIRQHKLQNISLERLMQALASLDQQVEIVVRPAQGVHGGSITVAA